MLPDYGQVVVVSYSAFVGIGLLSLALVLIGRELAKLSWFKTPEPVENTHGRQSNEAYLALVKAACKLLKDKPKEHTYGGQANEEHLAVVNAASKLVYTKLAEVKDPGST